MSPFKHLSLVIVFLGKTIDIFQVCMVHSSERILPQLVYINQIGFAISRNLFSYSQLLRLVFFRTIFNCDLCILDALLHVWYLNSVNSVQGCVVYHAVQASMYLFM